MQDAGTLTVASVVVVFFRPCDILDHKVVKLVLNDNYVTQSFDRVQVCH